MALLGCGPDDQMWVIGHQCDEGADHKRATKFAYVYVRGTGGGKAKPKRRYATWCYTCFVEKVMEAPNGGGIVTVSELQQWCASKGEQVPCPIEPTDDKHDVLHAWQLPPVFNAWPEGVWELPQPEGTGKGKGKGNYGKDGADVNVGKGKDGKGKDDKEGKAGKDQDKKKKEEKEKDQDRKDGRAGMVAKAVNQPEAHGPGPGLSAKAAPSQPPAPVQSLVQQQLPEPAQQQLLQQQAQKIQKDIQQFITKEVLRLLEAMLPSVLETVKDYAKEQVQQPRRSPRARRARSPRRSRSRSAIATRSSRDEGRSPADIAAAAAVAATRVMLQRGHLGHDRERSLRHRVIQTVIQDEERGRGPRRSRDRDGNRAG